MALSSKPERYGALRTVYLFGEGVPYEVESTWFHNGRLIFKFKGVDSISAAERLAGSEVRIPLSERAPLESGEHYLSDLIGCEMFEQGTNVPLGVVTGWEEPGERVVLVVDRGPEGEMLVPFAKAICLSIDLEKRRIVVSLPEGLKDLNLS